MTNPRRQHVAKSDVAREMYRRYIGKLDYEPTLDETLPFAESDRGTGELAQAVPVTKRRATFSERFSEHFHEHWVEWIMSALLVVLMYFMFGSKMDISNIKTVLGNIKERLSEVQSDVKSNTSANHAQDLSIRETQLRIETLSKDTERNSERLQNRQNQDSPNNRIERDSGKAAADGGPTGAVHP